MKSLPPSESNSPRASRTKTRRAKPAIRGKKPREQAKAKPRAEESAEESQAAIREIPAPLSGKIPQEIAPEVAAGNLWVGGLDPTELPLVEEIVRILGDDALRKLGLFRLPTGF